MIPTDSDAPSARRAADVPTSGPSAVRPIAGPPLGVRERRDRGIGWRSRDVARATVIVFGIYVLAQLLWFANSLVFVVFLGVLFGLAVASAVDRLERFKIRRGIASALVVFGTVGALVGVGALIAPALTTQFGVLRQQIPAAINRAERWVETHPRSVVALAARTALGTGAAPAAAAPAPGVPAAPPGLRRSAGAPLAPILSPRAAAESAATRAADSVVASASRSRGDTAAASDTSAAPGDTAGGQVVAGTDAPADSGQRTPAPAGDSAATRAAVRAAAAAAAQVASQNAAQQVTAAQQQAEQQAAQPQGGQQAGQPTGQQGAGAQSPQGGAPSAVQNLQSRIGGQLSKATGFLFGFLSSLGTVVAGLVLIIFLAIYIGAEPTLYRDGLMHLFPHRARNKAGEVLTEMATVLRKWLVTQLIAMVVIGTVTATAMALLNVKAALALGFIAGVLEFVPTVGPILSAVPALAMGFVDGPEKALAVLAAYWGIQFLENNLLIPFLMRGGMDLPPAVTLVAQGLLTLIFGFLGLMVAVPLTAAVLVPVKLLWVRDTIGDDIGVRDDEDDDSGDDDQRGPTDTGAQKPRKG